MKPCGRFICPTKILQITFVYIFDSVHTNKILQITLAICDSVHTNKILQITLAICDSVRTHKLTSGNFPSSVPIHRETMRGCTYT